MTTIARIDLVDKFIPIWNLFRISSLSLLPTLEELLRQDPTIYFRLKMDEHRDLQDLNGNVSSEDLSLIRDELLATQLFQFLKEEVAWFNMNINNDPVIKKVTIGVYTDNYKLCKKIMVDYK
jgi:hypothetical protein